MLPLDCWTRMPTVQHVPLSSSCDLVREREGHCSALATLQPVDGLPARYVVVVAGGYVEGSFEADAVAADVSHLVADTDPQRAELSWYVTASNVKVFETDGMSMCSDVCRSRFLLFGGLEGDSYSPRSTTFAAQWCWSSDDARATLLQLEVAELRTVNPPEPRWRHSAAILEELGLMCIFGGGSATCDQTNHLNVLCLETGVWQSVTLGVVKDSLPPSQPSARFLSSLVPVLERHEEGTATLISYGGAYFPEPNSAQTSLNDVWLCQLIRPGTSGASVQWRQAAVSGGDAAQQASQELLPCVNGHVGFRLCEGSLTSSTTVCFVGGKDFAEGTDDVFAVTVPDIRVLEHCGEHSGSSDVDVVSRRLQVRAAASDVQQGLSPHWRYTLSHVALPSGQSSNRQGRRSRTLLIAGQCRHPDPTSVYLMEVVAPL